MPTYDYECTKCGREFCVEQSMKDAPLKRCGECGGKLRKLLPRSLNLIFKGSGFYITDYPKGKRDRRPERERGPGPEAGGGGKEKPSGAGKEGS